MILFSCTTWFLYFLIRNLIHFFSSLHCCNWPKNPHHHTFSRHHANQEWLIFPTTTLITGTTLIKNGSSFPPPRLLRAPRLFGREEYLLKFNNSSTRTRCEIFSKLKGVKYVQRRRNFFYREQPKTEFSGRRPDSYFTSRMIPNLIQRSKALVFQDTFLIGPRPYAGNEDLTKLWIFRYLQTFLQINSIENKIYNRFFQNTS